MRWLIYRLMEKILNKWENETYHFRKYIYLKILKLKVCHFCLRPLGYAERVYCWECSIETN